MNQEQFIWNINYNAHRIQEAVEVVEPLIDQLCSNHSEELTPEETWKLKEAIRTIDVHNLLTKDDLRVMNIQMRKPWYKKLFRK